MAVLFGERWENRQHFELSLVHGRNCTWVYDHPKVDCAEPMEHPFGKIASWQKAHHVVVDAGWPGKYSPSIEQ